MRVVIGIVLGAALTVLGAYAFDSLANGPAANQTVATHRTMVNWDVVGANWGSLKSEAHRGWNKLSALLEK